MSQQQQQPRNEISRVASSDDASLADDTSIVMMPSGGDGTEERTLRALRRTSKQLDGILRDLSKEISRQSAHPGVVEDGDADMSDDEEHGEKQLKVELESTVLPLSDRTLKATTRRKESELVVREVTGQKANTSTSTPSPLGTTDLEQPEQYPETHASLPTHVSLFTVNQVTEKPHEDFLTSGTGEKTIISEQGQSMHQQNNESCQLTSVDLAPTNDREQGSAEAKASHKKNLMKWILCFCLLFISCLAVVLVVTLSFGTASTETPMVSIVTTNTSFVPTLSPNASETLGMEDSLEAPIPATSPMVNQTSVTAQSQLEDQSSPSPSPVEVLDQVAEPPSDDERLDLVKKGYHPKKGLGNRR